MSGVQSLKCDAYHLLTPGRTLRGGIMQEVCISAQLYGHMLKIIFLNSYKIEQGYNVCSPDAAYTEG